MSIRLFRTMPEQVRASRELLNGTHLWRSRIHMLLGTLEAAKARSDKSLQCVVQSLDCVCFIGSGTREVKRR